jgi:hypothetical protein
VVENEPKTVKQAESTRIVEGFFLWHLKNAFLGNSYHFTEHLLSAMLFITVLLLILAAILHGRCFLYLQIGREAPRA